MSDKFTKEDIKKAIEQADANMDFEEVVIPELNKESKVLKKDFKNEPRRSN